ncbi:contractile injection system tape measure protein [Thalassococcus sp. BH17M4-6]|uniref:contractile injection system tape measure protein n=1 Tax=Thalassococcus sp. BH17M4-6 TaxID=3413148 RepID=UPI003BCAE782
MIAIQRLHNRYQIAGNGAARVTLARRLDHICGQLLAQALEDPARDFADPDGPVYKIRKLKLRLWLNMAVQSDGQIATDWARLLARALHRQLAEAGPDTVMRYPGQAAFLAAWVAAVLDGVAQDRWMFAEFAVFDGLPAGRSISAGLARHPGHIAATFRALAGQGQRDRVIAAFTVRDTEVLWTAWTGARPKRAEALPRALLERVAGLALTTPVFEPGGAAARARCAFRWLLVLTAAPVGLSPQSAAPLAMQLAQLAALFHAVPQVRQVWARTRPDAAELRQAVAQVPGDLAQIAQWAATLIAREDLASARKSVLRVLPDTTPASAQPRMTTGKGPTKGPEVRLHTPFAGAVLLLPAMRRADPDLRWTDQYRHHLLAGLFTGTDRLLANGDFGLRHLSGLPPEAVLDPPPDTLDEDRAQLLDLFRRDLRGMGKASPDYLRAQFFLRPGTLRIGPECLHMRIQTIPLKVLLQLAGRLGEQGTVPWLGDLPLRIEVGDG